MFRPLARQLCDQGIRGFRRLPPVACRRAIAPFGDLPARDERFFWPEIAGGRCRTWENDRDRNAVFLEAVQTVARPPQWVDLLFHTELSGMRIVVESLQRAAPFILDAVDDTLWVVPKSDPGWIIEVASMDTEICLLSRPA